MVGEQASGTTMSSMAYLGRLTLLSLCVSLVRGSMATDCGPQFQGKCLCGIVDYQERMHQYVVNCTNSGFKNTAMLEFLPSQTEEENRRNGVKTVRKGVGYGKEQVKQDEKEGKDQLVTTKKACQGVERGSCDSTANLEEGDVKIADVVPHFYSKLEENLQLSRLEEHHNLNLALHHLVKKSHEKEELRKNAWGVPFQIEAGKIRPPAVISTLKKLEGGITTCWEESARLIMDVLLPDDNPEERDEENKRVRKDMKMAYNNEDVVVEPVT
uniref:Uncharacterized protein n=1 Tax=Timema bartmani TaxID=61472 RepID=A0A7R9ELR3_9NEOP|nr:unnamed protein product [Timema bartmani]